MAKFSKGVKQIVSSLALQDAEEFLPRRYKMKALGIGAETHGNPAATPRIDSRNRTRHRIALITDGRGLGAPVDYAIDASERQDVTIDPPIHCAFSSVP